MMMCSNNYNFKQQPKKRVKGIGIMRSSHPSMDLILMEKLMLTQELVGDQRQCPGTMSSMLGLEEI